MRELSLLFLALFWGFFSAFPPYTRTNKANSSSTRIVGSISAALIVQSTFLPEEECGLLSRTAAGNRAYQDRGTWKPAKADIISFPNNSQKGKNLDGKKILPSSHNDKILKMQ